MYGRLDCKTYNNQNSFPKPEEIAYPFIFFYLAMYLSVETDFSDFEPRHVQDDQLRMSFAARITFQKFMKPVEMSMRIRNYSKAKHDYDASYIRTTILKSVFFLALQNVINSFVKFTELFPCYCIAFQYCPWANLNIYNHIKALSSLCGLKVFGLCHGKD